MAGGSSKSNPPRPRKRVEVETTSMKRAKDGSAFTKCDECQRNVPVGLIDMHDCSMDSKIRMNLEAQIVEKVTESKKPERKKVSSSTQKEKKPKKEKKGTASKKSKRRPPTAFFLFMDDFRKEYKEANPDNKNVATVAKEGGEKWKAMTDEEKKAYRDRAAELKAEYEKGEMNDECEKEEEKGEAEEKEEEEKKASDNDEE